MAVLLVDDNISLLSSFGHSDLWHLIRQWIHTLVDSLEEDEVIDLYFTHRIGSRNVNRKGQVDQLMSGTPKGTGGNFFQRLDSILCQAKHDKIFIMGDGDIWNKWGLKDIKELIHLQKKYRQQCVLYYLAFTHSVATLKQLSREVRCTATLVKEHDMQRTWLNLLAEPIPPQTPSRCHIS